MASRPCPECDVNWPSGFITCPTCDVPTKFNKTGKAIAREEAVLLQKAAQNRKDFEAFYAEREIARMDAGLPSPEDKGRREAQRLIRGWRMATIALNSGKVPDERS